MTDIRASVIYRTGPLTVKDYDEAIEMLQGARKDLLDKAAGEGIWGCYCCEDTGHTAESCHHNPLLAARDWAAATAVYQCYHCGFVAKNDEEAREHFGTSDEEVAKCIRDRAGPLIESFPGIKAVSLLIAYDNGFIHRECTQDAWLKSLDPILGADGGDTADLRELDAFCQGLSEEERETLAAGEEADQQAVAARCLRPELCGLFNDIFEGADR